MCPAHVLFVCKMERGRERESVLVVQLHTHICLSALLHETSHAAPFFRVLCLSCFIPSRSMAVMAFRAMVVGKCTQMYSALLKLWADEAASHVLIEPRAVNAGSGGPASRKAPLVSITMDFETVQRDGFFLVMSHVLDGSPNDCHGRAFGGGVHFKCFLLAPLRQQRQ